MKAHLLHRDHDVDFTLTLDHGRFKVTGPELPGTTDDTIQDFELDSVLDTMGAEDVILREIARRVLLTPLPDPAAIAYRQDALSDCMENEEVVRELLTLAFEAVSQERRAPTWIRQPEGILRRSLEVMEMFVRTLHRLRDMADLHGTSFSSEAFSTLFAMLQSELSDDYFASVEGHLKQLRFREGVFMSATFGPGLRGAGYVLRSPTDTSVPLKERLGFQAHTEYHWDLHPRDEAGARALVELRDRGIRLVADALAQSTSHIASFFVMLGIELGFYVSCLNLSAALRGLDRPVCLPVPKPTAERSLRFCGLCDAGLSLRPETRVVGNDADADGRGLVMVTGANSGGKSTFLRSLGQAQLMMQAGMFVIAQSFSGSVHDGIFTHFIREEDPSMKSGKLDEEMARMSSVADRLTPGSIVFFNESFAATNEREGSEIASRIVGALMDSGVMVVFVTHQFTLADSFARDPAGNALFLRADREADGTRPFKLVEGRPLRTSFGEDLYRRIGGWGAPPGGPDPSAVPA